MRDKLFVWERPLRRKDLEALGSAAPDGAILVRLDRIGPEDLREVIVEAWLVRAPKRLAREYLEANG